MKEFLIFNLGGFAYVMVLFLICSLVVGGEDDE